jgi:dTDP-4-dehydrorhamnose reductase
MQAASFLRKRFSIREALMKVVVTGSNGQLAGELRKSIPGGWMVTFLPAAGVDLRDGKAVARALEKAGPQLLINAAAYTAVDKAESEQQLAFAVNSDGVAHLVAAADRLGTRVIHLSTDFVFDGRKSSPYLPDDLPGPLSVYGASKLAGERHVLADAAKTHVVIRTSWLYAARGGNFVGTMLRLMRERDEIGVVADQIGSPTWAGGLAEAIWRIGARPEISGIHHWTDAGVASWYDFAVAIQEEALATGLLARKAEIIPMRTEQYPTPARRPPYSVLDKTRTWAELAFRPPHWRSSLRRMLGELKGSEG